MDEKGEPYLWMTSSSTVHEMVEDSSGTVQFHHNTNHQNISELIVNNSSVYADERILLFHGYSTLLLKFASICCILFMVIGLPGNLITIVALCKCKKVLNATAIFIINLSASDLMFCCFNLPLASSTFWSRRWTHGQLLCELFPLLRYGLLAVSLFTILAITINRYVMISHPNLYPRLYRRRYLAVMVASTWIFAFGAVIPTWFGKWGHFGLDVNIGSCTILPDEQGSSPKQYLFLIAFVIPCVSIAGCYARIFYIVRKTAKKSHITNNARSNTVATTVTAASAVTTVGGGGGTIGTNEKRTTANNKLQHPHQQQYQQQQSAQKSTVSSSGNDDSAIGSSSGGRSSSVIINESETSCEFATSKRSSVPSSSGCCSYNNNNNNSNLLTLPVLTNPYKTHFSRVAAIAADPSSSSGLEMSREDFEDDMMETSRSMSPTSLCSSRRPSTPTGGGPGFGHHHHHHERGHFQRERTPSTVNIALNHMVCALRRNSPIVFSPRRRRKSTLPSGPGKMSTKDKKLLKMILVIFASFLVCYLPITLTKICRSLDRIHWLHIFGYLLIYMTTCINPIIYVVMSSEYRQAYKNLLMCRQLESRSGKRARK